MTILKQTDFTKSIQDAVSKEVAEPLSEIKVELATQSKRLANQLTNIQLESENKKFEVV